MGYLSHATATDGGVSTNPSVLNDKPAGVTDGCLMIWAIHADITNAAGIFSWPAGWTAIPAVDGQASSSVDQAVLGVAYKVASGEGANYTCTLSTSDWWCSTIIAYDNCPASPYDTQSNSGADSTADAGPSWTIDALSLTTATDSEILLWIAAIDNATSIVTAGTITYTPPSGFTDRGSVADTNWCSIGWADFTQATAGGSGSISSTANVASDTGNAGQMAVLIAIKQNATTAPRIITPITSVSM